MAGLDLSGDIMRYAGPLLIFLLLLLTASPQIAPAKTGAKTGALAEIDAKLRTNFPQVESISAADLQTRMGHKDAPIILDVREKDEFESAICKARSASIQMRVRTMCWLPSVRNSAVVMWYFIARSASVQPSSRHGYGTICSNGAQRGSSI